MSTRPFNFPGASGQALSGRLETPGGPVVAWALFAHCFTCTKDSLAAARVSRALAVRGVGVLRFDFTGLGDSEGDFSDGGFSRDVGDLLAAARAMAAAGMAPTLLVGHSLGGAAALAAAPDLPDLKAVATIGAPFDPSHVAGQFGAALKTILEDGQGEVLLGGRPFTVRRAFFEDLRMQKPGERIARLHKALLVLHSPQDAVVGVENATAIFVAARHPKSFVSLDGADHLLTRVADADYAAEVIAAWSSRYLGPAPVLSARADQGARVEETGAGGFQVRISAGGAVFMADEPIAIGGRDTGPTPYDILCAGLGACTVMTLRMYADQKGWPVARLAAEVTHVKDAGADPPDRFIRRIIIEGAADAAQRARLLEIAGRCPVHQTLERGSRIETAEAPPSV